ncbi:unnamed protein product [Scytosiphon promiscuus]
MYRTIDGKCIGIRVQRYIWNLTHPDISKGQTLSNSCSNHNCINPSHLEIVPKSLDDVWKRMLEKTRRENECLLWTGCANKGYGQTTVYSKIMSAHRASYLIKTKGEPIPREIDGMTAHVRHLCGKSLCVNPDHLEIGTIVSNHQDKAVHGTSMVGQRSHLAKITEEKATQIKTSKLCEEEDGFESQAERAERFGVSLSIVRSIDSGKTWCHVKDRFGNTTNNDRLRKRKRETYSANQKQVWGDKDFEAAGEILYKRISKSTTDKRCDIPGDCWNFTGCTSHGYGQIQIMGKHRGAHVMSCEIAIKRAIEPREVTRHLCGNKLCIAPHHLQFGDPSDNGLDCLKHWSRACKLDEEKVRNIRSSSLSAKELSKMYHVTPIAIYKVLSGERWGHVE